MRAKTICIYGESGASKTSQCIYLAKFIKEKHNRNTRLISSDPGGWEPIEKEGLIRSKDNPEGIVEAFNMTNRPNYLADWRKLSKGYWPKVVRGEASMGEDPNKNYRKFVMSSSEEMRLIGAYFIEGLTSISSGFISHISQKDNSKDSSQKVMYTAPGYDEDGEHFGATDQGHVGMVQNELFNLVQNFGTLSMSVVMWTALVGECTAKALRKIGLESTGLDPVYGPKLAGSAKTAEAPSWFSDCFHLDKDDDTGKVRAYFRRHVNKESGLTFLAKCSTSPTEYRKLEKMFEGGGFELSLENGIGAYLREVL